MSCAPRSASERATEAPMPEVPPWRGLEEETEEVLSVVAMEGLRRTEAREQGTYCNHNNFPMH